MKEEGKKKTLRLEYKKVYSTQRELVIDPLKGPKTVERCDL